MGRVVLLIKLKRTLSLCHFESLSDLPLPSRGSPKLFSDHQTEQRLHLSPLCPRTFASCFFSTLAMLCLRPNCTLVTALALPPALSHWPALIQPSWEPKCYLLSYCTYAGTTIFLLILILDWELLESRPRSLCYHCICRRCRSSSDVLIHVYWINAQISAQQKWNH